MRNDDGKKSLRGAGHYPHRIYGVDFSGAMDAGKKIWIASGCIEDDSLQITDCYRCDNLPGSGKNRDQCLTALVEFIARSNRAAFGLDFPFGLPKELVQEQTWEEFVFSFTDHYESSEAFREACRSVAPGKEKRRLTDLESESLRPKVGASREGGFARYLNLIPSHSSPTRSRGILRPSRKTPFSPYNLRLFRQTYFGISSVLSPLVREHKACVLPMQQPSSGKTWVLEICPASTLKRLNLYGLHKYKGKTESHREARSRVLVELEKTGPLQIQDPAVFEAIVENRGGDALDSVIAALATFWAIRNPDDLFPDLDKGNESYRIEGYVFI